MNNISISPNLSQMAYNAQSPLRGDSGANKRKRGLTRGKHGRTRLLLRVPLTIALDDLDLTQKLTEYNDEV